MPAILRTLLREPLIHFLVLGALVFALVSQVGNTDQNRDDLVIVSEQDIARLQSLWQAQYSKPPTDEELSAIIDQHVREEILYRAAMKLGLGQDDMIVRRRLVQKFLFLSEGLVEIEPPSDTDIENYFSENLARYMLPTETSFMQVYFKANPSDEAPQRANKTLLELNEDNEVAAAWRQQGDPFMLPREFAERTDAEIINLFGPDFVDTLPNLAVGQWTGPVPSAYGWHVVMIAERTASIQPSLADVRTLVSTDLVEEKRRQANEDLYQSIQEQYVVVIEDRPSTD